MALPEAEGLKGLIGWRKEDNRVRSWAVKRGRLALGLVMPTLLAACAGLDPVVERPRVEGRIQDWSPGYTLEAHLLGERLSPSYGQVAVDAQGGFSYTLPVPHPEDLSSVQAILGLGLQGCSAVSLPTVTDQNARVAILELVARDGQGWPYYVRLLNSVRTQRGLYVYFDRATSVRGSYEATCQGVRQSQSYSITAFQGWNYVEVAYLGYNRYQVYSRSTPSQDLAWRLR